MYEPAKVDGHPGQFVIVLTLSKDVGIALKDHGGATSAVLPIREVTMTRGLRALEGEVSG